MMTWEEETLTPKLGFRWTEVTTNWVKLRNLHPPLSGLHWAVIPALDENNGSQKFIMKSTTN